MNFSNYRYVKCLNVGMTPESVLSDEEREAKYKNRGDSRKKKKKNTDSGIDSEAGDAKFTESDESKGETEGDVNFGYIGVSDSRSRIQLKNLS